MKKSKFSSFFPTVVINELGKTTSKLRSINSAKDDAEKEKIFLEYAYDSIKTFVVLEG